MATGAAPRGKSDKGKPNRQNKAKPGELAELAQALIRSAGTNICIVKEGRFQYVSLLFQELTGYSEQELLDKYSLDLVHPEDRETVRKKAIESLKGYSSLPYEYRLIKKSGEVMWIVERITSTEYEGKRAFVVSFMDITERKRLEEALTYSEERYRTILEDMEDNYFEVDFAGNFNFVNDSTCRTLGYSREELTGMNYRACVAEEDIEVMYQDFNRVYQTGDVVKGLTYRFIRKDGSTGFGELSVSALKNEKGEVIGFRGIGRDITERKQLEQKLRDVASHDSLTGLPNRRLLNDRMGVALAQAQRSGTKLCVMMLDLDKFKDVNDTLGHSVGDQLLKAVGERLMNLIRKSDTVARMGGDEFVLVLSRIPRVEDAIKVAQKVLDAFLKPFVLNGRKLYITTSIGIAVYPEDGTDAETLVKHADTAMYCAKEQGRATYELYWDDGTKTSSYN